MVVEVMGRHAGWIALMSGMAGGADAILTPEFPLTIEDLCEVITRRQIRGKTFSVIVVSEGAPVLFRSGASQEVLASDELDAFGHVKLGGVGTVIAREVKKATGLEVRETILGYIQRGGTPTAHDRILGTRFGVKAAQMVEAGEWGMMAGLKGDAIEAVPLSEAVSSWKLGARGTVGAGASVLRVVTSLAAAGWPVRPDLRVALHLANRGGPPDRRPPSLRSDLQGACDRITDP